MGMWHVIQKLILLLGLFLKEITRSEGSQGDAHKVRGWGKSMLPAGSYLVWEWGFHGDLHGLIARAGVGELERSMPPMNREPGDGECV